ncbi:MAG: winged helix-turn-helix transcriptional regulator [Parcubacteria group bacterium]|nr:winged helix-turn-helix transcriptional regulator [Parcubacteria group bacterium]
MKRFVHEPHKIFFETLGNDTRWEIVHLLQKKQCNATGIAKALGYEQSLVSHHLRRLERCGFVRVTREGKERIYELNKTTIKPLLKLMDSHINAFCKKIADKELCKKL